MAFVDAEANDGRASNLAVWKRQSNKKQSKGNIVNIKAYKMSFDWFLIITAMLLSGSFMLGTLGMSYVKVFALSSLVILGMIFLPSIMILASGQTHDIQSALAANLIAKNLH